MKSLTHLIASFFIAASVATQALAIEPVDLRCEYVENPIGIDITHPRLSWRVTSDEHGQSQSAFRILVASSAEKLGNDEGNLWDSGKVASDQTLFVEYSGQPLNSRQLCFWKVQVWAGTDEEPTASDPASWSIGLLEDSDWSADYISFRDETPIHKDVASLYLPAARQYRKEFTATKKVKRATVYATALGIYELHLNGSRVGDVYFAPGWTDYRQRAYYNTYNVTDLIRSGDNAMGAWVADGWYSGYVGFGLLTGMGTEKTGRATYGKTPSLMTQLEIEYTDGSRQIVGTDETWKVTGDGPVQEADLLMGEAYDARKETPGWSTAGFDDSNWQVAIFAKDNGNPTATFFQRRNPTKPGQGVRNLGAETEFGFKRPELESFPGVPVRVTEEIPAKKVTPREPGTFIFDLGQNFAGTIRLKVKGPAGQRIQIRYGEMLHPDGRLMTENLRKARATDFYSCKGDPEGEIWEPRFTFHGFQFVELANCPGTPTVDAVTGLVLHSDTPMTSTFECSDPMVNQLFKNVVWTQRANFLDLPTDCPQRDERMGWTGDAQAYVATAAYNADIGAFYTKWLRELMESQRPSGAFPGYAPFPFQHGWDFGTAWADAGVICPWTVWQFYGQNGATTIWERWDSYTKEDAFGRHNAAMNSFSHYAFGAVCEWMFSTLAGIQSDGPGFKKIVIRPSPPSPGSNAMHEPIDWVRASYESIRGTIRSDWKLQDGQFHLNVAIPANTTATVYLPTSDASSITEGGKSLPDNHHVRLVGQEGRVAVLSVASGGYQFVAASGIATSAVALKTSKPKDTSVNPDGIDLTGATRLALWDFSKAADTKKWIERSNVEIQQRDGSTYVVATGDDSQMAARLKQPAKGKLVIELRAKLAQGGTSQFFWAYPGRGFNGQQQSQRALRESDQVNAYLFSVRAEAPVGKIRFDPFATYDKYANSGEMLIESIAVYQIAD